MGLGGWHGGESVFAVQAERLSSSVHHTHEKTRWLGVGHRGDKKDIAGACWLPT